MTTPPGYALIGNQPAFHDALTAVAAAPTFGLDLETTGLDPRHDSIVGISMSVGPNQGWYVPIGHINTNFPQPPLDVVVEALRLILETVPDRGQSVAMHHAKFDTNFLRRAGVNTPDSHIHDTLLETFSDGEPHYRLGLKYLARQLFGAPLTSYEDLVSTVHERNMAAVPVQMASDYACQDADFCLRIHQLKHPLVENIMSYHLENLLWPVLRGAEERGMHFNGAWHDGTMEQMERTVQFIQQAAESNPDPQNISAHQTVTELAKDLAGDNLGNYVDQDTGRIYPRYWQVGDFAGACATTDPCLERLGQFRSWHILGQNGRVTRVTHDPLGSFAASPGYYFLTAEYRQPEMLVFGVESQNADMIGGYTQSGDVHMACAARDLGRSPDQVTRQERDHAKIRNYRHLYADPNPDQPPDDIITAYRNALHQQASGDGFLTTFSGRRIPLGTRPHSPGHVNRLHVKGCTSDAKKLALLRMSQIMQAKYPEEDVRLTAFVNGKQVWEVLESIPPAQVAAVFQQGMTTPEDRYPFIVDVRAGLHLGNTRAVRD